MTSPADTMAVAVYRRPGEVVVEDRPVPVPGPGEVLVEVEFCGVCGSDLHLLVEGMGKPGTVAGHELSGTLVATGPDVTEWKTGERVVQGPSPRCGHCRRCLEGQPSQCEARGSGVDEHLGGGFAGYVLLDAGSLRRVPEGLSDRHAALAEPLAVSLHAVTRARLEPGDSVMVFGAGPIGALAIAVLVTAGDHEVTVVEPGEVRRQLARRLGAHHVMEPTELERYPRWEPERLAPHAVDAVLECSGKKAAMESGLYQLRRGGRLVLVGAGMEEPTFDPNRILLNEVEILGSFVYDANGFERALEMLASGRLPMDVLVEEGEVTLDGLPGALAGLAEGRIAGKVLVVPRRSGDTVPG